jgi:hypothetical protein
MNTTFVWLPTVQLRPPVVDYVQILPVPPEVSKYTDLEQDRYRVRVLQDVIRKSKSAGNQDGGAVYLGN